MEEFKHLIKISLLIVEKAGPTLAIFGGAYFAFKFAIKQKKFENKTEDDKKVRVVVSNLLQIWKEFSLIKQYTQSDDFYAKIIFTDHFIASDYFKIDVNRINELQQNFNRSKEEIKAIDILLFYKLESIFSEFNESLKFFDENPMNNREFANFSKDIYIDLVKQIEDVIILTSDYLPQKEKNEVSSIIEKNNIEISKTDFDIEIPNYALKLINRLLPVNEKITADEIKILMHNDNVKLIFAKLIPLVSKVLFNKDSGINLSQIFNIFENPSLIEDQITEIDFFKSLYLTDEENMMFQNNIAFYKLICGIYKKFDKNIPFGFKRSLLTINNGTINIKKELELKQKELISNTSPA